MSVFSMQRAVCNSLVQSFDSLIAPAVSIKGKLFAYKRQLRNYLNNIIFSPDINTIQNELASIRSSVLGLYPGADVRDMQALKDIIDHCLYLEKANPISTIYGTKIGIFNGMYDLISGSPIPELVASGIASLINSLLNGLGIPGGSNIGGLLGQADHLINCLTVICGPVDSAYLTLAADYATRLDDVYGDLNIIGDPINPEYGTFNYPAFYTEIGLTNPNYIAQLDTAIAGVESIKVDNISAINNSVSTAKQFLKNNFF